jgi:trk system potassium uptake protein TrkH
MIKVHDFFLKIWYDSKNYNNFHDWILSMKSKNGLVCFLTSMSPVRLVALGYLSYILLGWIILCLPFSHRGSHVNSLDNLFIAVSALSTTGLATVDISEHYTFFGQIVILLLIELGGIGYMTFGSFVVLSRGRRLSGLREEISKNVFSLPKEFRIDKFIRSVVIFTMIVELIGACALYAIFRSAEVKNSLWNSVFHSISAFCTAGFSLFSNSMESFSSNFWLNAVISVLSLIGAVGFIVLVDIWRRMTGKIQHITFTSNVILRMSFLLLIIGTILFLFTEPLVRTVQPDSRIMISVFQAMTAMTTVGFNSIPIGSLATSSLLILLFLMIIGASPSGTGGGIKCTSFSALVGIIRSTLRGDTRVRFLGRAIPQRRVQAAMANIGFYLFVLIVGIYALTVTENFDFRDIFFEAASALGTVGLSTGITSTLSVLGKIIICFLMFVGRLGPLTFAIALSAKPLPNENAIDDVAV